MAYTTKKIFNTYPNELTNELLHPNGLNQIVRTFKENFVLPEYLLVNTKAGRENYHVRNTSLCKKEFQTSINILTWQF